MHVHDLKNPGIRSLLMLGQSWVMPGLGYAYGFIYVDNVGSRKKMCDYNYIRGDSDHKIIFDLRMTCI